MLKEMMLKLIENYLEEDGNLTSKANIKDMDRH